MDLNKELNDLSKRNQGYIDNNQVKGEQATIDYLIKPFLRILGFDDSNPAEVIPEFTADIGTKKGEKVDFAICKDSKVIMLIECKDCNTGLSQEEFSQLYRYFTVITDARIGVLTNGILYKFYTDSENPNVMDSNPFFEFNMTEILPSIINVLSYFTKEKFDLGITRSVALDLKQREEIKRILMKQLDSPTKEFVEFFKKAINSKMKIQDFTDVVKRAFNEFLDETYNDLSDEHDEEVQAYKNEDDRGQNEGKVEEPSKSKDRQVILTNIKVTMPDGSVIYHYSGKATYLEVIEKLGLEEVKRVRPEIVSDEQFPQASKKGVKLGGFFVKGTNGFDTKWRVEELKTIAKLLNKDLKVEQKDRQVILTNIKVTMPDGSVIYHYSGKATYLEVIEKLGLEEVKRVRPEIVSDEQFPQVSKKGVKLGDFFVKGTNGFDTKQRVEELKTIAKLLNKDLKVEQVVKTTKPR